MSEKYNKISFYWGVPGILFQFIGACGVFANLPRGDDHLFGEHLLGYLIVFIIGTFLLLAGIIYYLKYIKYHVLQRLAISFFLITYQYFFLETIILGIMNISGCHELATELQKRYEFFMICRLLSLVSVIVLLYLSTHNKEGIQKKSLKTKTGIIISNLSTTSGIILFSLLYLCGNTILGKPFWGTIQNSDIEMYSYSLQFLVQPVNVIIGVKLFYRMNSWRIFPILTLLISGFILITIRYGVF